LRREKARVASRETVGPEPYLYADIPRIPHVMYKRIGKSVLILLFSVIISYLYVRLAEIFEPVSLIRHQSAFQVPPEFGLRFLLPSTIAFILPAQSYDTITFRFSFALASIVLCFIVIQPFGRRVLSDPHADLRPAIQVSIFLILLCHYCLRSTVYYVYDFPAIVFYMTSFLLLTSKTKRIVIYGIFVTALCSMNRETIIIAAIHAAAFVIVRDWSSRYQSLVRTLTPIVGTIVIIISLRILLAYWIFGVGLLSTVSTHEGESHRFVANVRHVISDHGSAFQLLLFGAGAIVWLPLFFGHMNNQMKLMLLFSIPALVVLLWAGNLVELRVYNEFVPLLTVLFSQASAYFFNNYLQTASSGKSVGG
jgi:hypothetical protein